MNNSFEGYIDKELSLELKERIVHIGHDSGNFLRLGITKCYRVLIKYRNSKKCFNRFYEIRRWHLEMVTMSWSVKPYAEIYKSLVFATSQLTKNNPADLFSDTSLKTGDITFVIPKHLRMTAYKEITNDDECQTGNFVGIKK